MATRIVPTRREEATTVSTAALVGEDEEDVQVDFMKLGKKKKGKKKDGKKKRPVAKAADAEMFNWDVEGHTSYQFEDLLNRIETIMNEKQSQMTEEAKDQRGDLPQTKFVSTKTSIINFDILCEQLNREKTHVLEFIKAEMDVEGNFGSEGNILL